MMFSALITALIPQLIRIIIDDIIQAGNYEELNRILLLALVVLLIKSFFHWYRVRLNFRVAQKVMYDLSKDMTSHLYNLSLRYYENNISGRIMSRVISDVNSLQQMIVMGSSQLVEQMLTIVGVIIFIFYMNWQLSAVTLLLFPALLIIIILISNRMRRTSKEIQKKIGEMAGVLQEAMAGIKVVQSFNRHDLELKKFSNLAYDRSQLGIQRGNLVAKMESSVDFTTNIATVIVLWYGGTLVINQQLSTGELASFILYIQLLFRPIVRMSMLNNVVQSGIASLERIYEVLDQKPEVAEKPNAIDMNLVKGEVEFRNVTFKHSEEPVLKKINLKVEPGDMVALVGPSGAGKTSLINLIARFYDVNEGAILIDGVDIRDVTLESLRRHIGMVLQEPILFSGTIKANLLYAKDGASKEEILTAAKAAHAHEFISQLPQGYDTEIGEKGVKLSVGQKQRIALAMAILMNPRILILDEATSSLDSESENLIQQALEKIYQKHTTFVIAHRLSTIVNAHRIVVIDKGEIVAIGNHEELLAKGGLYARLYNAQFNNYSK